MSPARMPYSSSSSYGTGSPHAANSTLHSDLHSIYTNAATHLPSTTHRHNECTPPPLSVLMLILAVGTAATLTIMALQRNLTYLYMPSEVLRGDTAQQTHFRLGGIVEKGSFQRTSGTLHTRFIVTDGNARLQATLCPHPPRPVPRRPSSRRNRTDATWHLHCRKHLGTAQRNLYTAATSQQNATHTYATHPPRYPHRRNNTLSSPAPPHRYQMIPPQPLEPHPAPLLLP